MPVLKKPHNIPAVPVASQVLDENGKLTQEFVYFLRALADLVRDIDDVEVLARASDWRPSAQSEIVADPGADTQILYNHNGMVTSDPNFTWNPTNQVATVTGKTGGAAYPAFIVTDPNTPHTAYVESDAGFWSGSPSYQAFQATAGGFSGNNLNLGGYLAVAENATQPPPPSSGDTWSPSGNPNSVGVMYYDYVPTPGTAYWYARYSTVGTTLADAYVSAAGMYASGAATNAIQAPNGGILAKDIAATDAAWNGLQNTNGGMAATAVYLKTNAAVPASPGTISGASYGGLGYQGGSTYWYWNGSAWASIDFAASTAPPGTDKQIIYNAAAHWGASAYLNWDYTNNRLGIGTAVPLDVLHVHKATDANLWVRLGGAISGAAGIGIDSINDANTARMPITIGGSAIILSQGNVGLGLTNPTYQLQLSTDNAYKQLTNAWFITSDIRLKTDLREYSDGLEKLRQVQPIRYRLNGKANLPLHAEGIGIDAAAHKDVLADCISTIEGEIDGEKTDIYQFNSHAIVFMLINAVKELAERLERIEQQHEPIRHWFSNLGFGRKHE
jgi:hypothetical protein